MRKLIKRYLEKLAEQNKKNFGSNRLDCCDLNKGKNGQTNEKKQKKA
jgi:hypothetical protein